MKRDNLRTEEYFTDNIKEQDKLLLRYTEMVEKAIEKKSGNERGIKNGLLIIRGILFRKLRLLYSSGADIAKLTQLMPHIIKNMEKTWDKDNGYTELIWTLSIACMLDTDAMMINNLRKKIEESGIRDFLVDFLLHYVFSDHNVCNETLQFRPYCNLVFILFDQKNMISKLKEYLVIKWYKGQSDKGWYESHKKSGNVYSGYWSFESGAIVKILGLDDTILKDVPYYPYDLVHYKDDK